MRKNLSLSFGTVWSCPLSCLFRFLFCFESRRIKSNQSFTVRSFINSFNSLSSVFLFFPSKNKNRNFALNVEPHPEISPPESWSLYPEGYLLFFFFPLGLLLLLLLWFIVCGREMATSIGIMDSAYFVGRNEILSWINNRLQLNLSRIEEVTLLVLSIIQWNKKRRKLIFSFLFFFWEMGFLSSFILFLCFLCHYLNAGFFFFVILWVFFIITFFFGFVHT